MAFRLKDLAKELGVSPSTISLTIHNRPGVSEATREKIFQALAEAGMGNLIPQEPVRPLKNLRFVLYKNGKGILADTPFFMQLIEGVDRQAKADGFNLMLTYLTAETVTPEQIEALAGNDCKGIILLATEMTPELVRPFKALGLPLISLDNNMEMEEINSVVINNILGSYQAVMELVRQGHTRIGYLKGDPGVHNFAERYGGYRQAMQDSKLSVSEDWIVPCRPSAEDAYAAMKEYLLSNGLTCTAFVADSDNILFGALKALREYHIPVPERVSVVGFDDMPLAEVYDPPLTTVHVPKRNMGAIAVSLMTAMLNNVTRQPVKLSVNTRLVVRKSTAPALE